MDELNYLLLFGPLCIGLIVTLLTMNDRKITQWVAVISSGITGLISLYLLVSVFIIKDISSFFILVTIYKSFKVDTLHISFQMDSLSRFMAFVASFLGMLIVIFSIEYMDGDKETGRYYFFIQLFIISMVLLVSAGDF